MHLVPRRILSSVDSCSTHLVNPPVEARGLLKRKVPPDKLEGMITRDLLSTGDKMGDISGINKVALLIGSGVHSDKTYRVGEERDSWVPSKVTRKEVITTQPSNDPSLI